MPSAAVLAILQSAVGHHQQGRLAEAEAGYRRILALEPDQPETLNLLGVLAAQTQRPDEAIDLLKRATRLNPRAAEPFFNLGQTLAQCHRTDEATTAYRQALAIKPDYARAWFGLGLCHDEKNETDHAEAAYRRAVQIDPAHVEALNNLGNTLNKKERYAEAIAALTQALRARPSHASAYYNLATSLRELKRYDEALAAIQRALELRPDLSIAWVNYGNILNDLGREDEAAAAFTRAIELDGSSTDAINNLAGLQMGQGNEAGAARAFEHVLQLNPQHAGAHNNLGGILMGQGRITDAKREFETALHFNPDSADAQFNLSMIYFLEGDYEKALPFYERRWDRNDARQCHRALARPRWKGEDLRGRTILVHHEQGFGDSIQAARYIPLLKERGARVFIECQKELVRLFRGLPEAELVVSETDPLPDFDVQCPFMSLPLAFGTRAETIPQNVPYLRPDPALRERWRQFLQPHHGFLKVGLCWAGQALPRGRSIPPERLAPLAAIEGIRLISLQKGAKDPAQIIPGLIDPTADIHDFADTAALMCELDLIVTIDTAVAHLAGALACPTWVLLKYSPDWRWTLDREDNLWYPTLRLFRQKQLGDWSAPIAAVQAALRDKAVRSTTTCDKPQ